MTGELGHVWEHAEGHHIPHALLTDHERQQGRSPRWNRGPLVCTRCGVPWPGKAPCTGRPL